MSRPGYIFLIMLGVLASASCRRPDPETLKAEVIREVNKSPMLYTVKAKAQVIVTDQDEPGSYKRYFGSRTVMIPVLATLKAGVDLSKIDKVKFDKEDGSIHIVLPPPVIEIESTTIDNLHIVTDVGALRYDFSEDEIAQLAARGRERIKELLPQLDLVKPAQERAAQMLASIAEELGYSKIRVDIPDYPVALYKTFLNK